MAKYRDEPYGAVLYASFLAALQEFIGTSAPNFHLTVANNTSVAVAAGANSGQVGLGIDGLWRYISAAATSSVTGPAGAYDVFAVTSANDFVNNPSPPPPELDETDYTFALQVLQHGNTPTLSPTVTNFRKLGELDWNGTKITGFRPMVGEIDPLSPLTPTASVPTVTPLRAIGVGSQTAPLQTWESPGGVVGSVDVNGSLTLIGSLTAVGATLSGTSPSTLNIPGGGATVSNGVVITGASGLVKLTNVAAANSAVLVAAVPSVGSQNMFIDRADGRREFGPGTGATDVMIKRDGPGVLRIRDPGNTVDKDLIAGNVNAGGTLTVGSGGTTTTGGYIQSGNAPNTFTGAVTVGGNFYPGIQGGGGVQAAVWVDSTSSTVLGPIVTNGTGFSSISDRALKKSIRDLDSDPVETLRAVRARSFLWRDRHGTRRRERDIGFVAQEVREAIPEAVHESEDGTLFMDRSKLVAPLWEACRAMLDRIEELEAR